MAQDYDKDIDLDLLSERYSGEFSFLESFVDREMIEELINKNYEKCAKLYCIGSMMERGYFFPDPTIEYYIGGLKRGKLSGKNLMPLDRQSNKYTYYFDNLYRLIFIEKEYFGKLQEVEYIRHFEDHSVGINLKVENGKIVRDQVQTVTYTKFNSADMVENHVIGWYYSNSCNRFKCIEHSYENGLLTKTISAESDFFKKSEEIERVSKREFIMSQDGKKCVNIHSKRASSVPDYDLQMLARLFADRIGVFMPDREITEIPVIEYDKPCNFRIKLDLLRRYQRETVEKKLGKR